MRADAACLALRWPRLAPGAAALAVFLFALFLAARYAGTLGGVPSGMALMCLGMAALPWILLQARGREQIGLRRATRAAWYPLALAAGALWALLAYLLGMALFGATAGHWFVTVADSYRAYPVRGFSTLQLHLMFTTAAILFSPIGEEIFFRGYLQQVLAARYGSRAADWIQAGAFGLVHLLHHGIIVSAAGVLLLPASAALWVALMTGFALLCGWLRRASASLYPAMLAHAAFNAAMNGVIFAFLWR